MGQWFLNSGQLKMENRPAKRLQKRKVTPSKRGSTPRENFNSLCVGETPAVVRKLNEVDVRDLVPGKGKWQHQLFRQHRPDSPNSRRCQQILAVKNGSFIPDGLKADRRVDVEILKVRDRQGWDG